MAGISISSPTPVTYGYNVIEHSMRFKRSFPYITWKSEKLFVETTDAESAIQGIFSKYFCETYGGLTANVCAPQKEFELALQNLMQQGKVKAIIFRTNSWRNKHFPSDMSVADVLAEQPSDSYDGVLMFQRGRGRHR